MKTNPLKRIAAAYTHMPNGGASLHVSSDGMVSNGMVLIHRFKNSWRAFHALRDAGFTRTDYGWRLAR